MAVTPVGSPPATVYTTTNGANTPTLAYGSTPVAGQLLVLAVTAAATTSVSAISAPSGWSTAANVGNGTTSNASAAIFYKIAAGSDAVPSLTVTTSGTTRCGFSVFQFSGVNTSSPVDTTGTFASGNSSGTISAITVTTGANVYQAGEYAIAAFAREQATAATATWTPGASWSNFTKTTTSTRDHDAVDTYSNPPSGATLSDAGTMTSAATSFAAAVIAVFSPATSGPPVSWTGPSGVRQVLVRTGLAMASLIPSVAVVPPPPVTPAPFFPLPWPVRARVPQNAPRGRASGSPGAPVRNPPTQGPVFRQAAQPCRARIPQNAQNTSERVGFNPGAPVRNPTQGPAFRQAVQAVRARLPLQPLLRGRSASNPGGPVQNPPPPAPPATAGRNQAVRAPLAPPGTANSFGRAATMVAIPAPVNPAAGPVFRQQPRPVKAQRPLPPRGTVASNPGGPVQNPAPGVLGPPFFPFRQAVRIRPVLPPRGRTAGNPGGPVRNPVPGVQGPVFYPFRQAVRIRPAPPPRGRAAGNPGGPVHNPPPVTTGPQYVRGQAVRGQVLPADSANFFGRAATMVALPAPVNPSITAGPVFRQATQAQAKIPPWSKGRIASSPGSVPVPPPQPGMSAGQPAGIRVIYLAAGRCQSTPAAAASPVPPPTQGPVFRQATSPARIRPSLPPRGKTAGNPGIPPAPPAVPAPVYPLHGPVQARVPLPPRGRVAGSPGGPVQNPVTRTGPPFFPLRWPARIRPSLPPRGRVSANPGAPVRNPVHGPAFIQAVRPIRAVIPQNAPRGRTASNPGGPVANIPFGNPLFRLGSPYFQWDTETPGLTSEWDTGTPVFAWAAGVPETSA